jgi:anthranilate synthase component 2
VFAGLPNPFTATRYHSLVVERDSLPECLEITAWTQTSEGAFDEIMGLRHRSLPIEGVQFHPESILTEHGHALLQNFLRL